VLLANEGYVAQFCHQPVCCQSLAVVEALMILGQRTGGCRMGWAGFVQAWLPQGGRQGEAVGSAWCKGVSIWHV
jgi:hypothetical protein